MVETLFAEGRKEGRKEGKKKGIFVGYRL